MKGLNAHGLRGRHISFSLIALICFTVLLYAWEKNRFVIPDQIAMPSSGFIVDSASNSFQKNSRKVNVELITRKETQEEDDYAAGTTNLNAVPSGIKHIYENFTLLTEPKGLPLNVRTDSSEMEKVKPNTDESRAELNISKETKKEEDGYVSAMIDFTATSSEREGKVCNYAKGRWIADSRYPLYSGLGCKQWLSGMWACRLTQRTDFSYEGYRWQPENCAVPAFERSTFLKRMQDKTIAFVGDSLGRQQFQSLMCMATGGEESPEVQDVGNQYGLVKAQGAARPDGWAYWFPNTNTTILYYWSASLTDLEPVNITNPATDVAMHLDRPPAFLRRFLHRFDVLVLNTGHHWNRGKLQANRWVMYVNGKPLKDRKLAQIGNAKNFTVYSIARWVDSQLPSHPRLKAFFRTISPRHFKHGDWNTGGSCDNTIPMSNGNEVLQDGSSDTVVEGALRGTKVKILDITALSELRDEGHISRYSMKADQKINDCLHWCLPGIPDAWNELLYAQI